MNPTAWHQSIDGGLGRLILDAPPVNILTRGVLAELRRALGELAVIPDLRALLLSARGRHFSAGADVGEHLPPQHEALIPEFLDTVAALDAFPLPTLAAVQGRCLGGGFELVLGVDLIVAAVGASFGQPEILLGVVPPAAAAWLPERCPRGLAAELVFTGDPVTAAVAAAGGLVHRVVDDGELEAAALTLARRICGHSAAALRAAKRTFAARRPSAAAALVAAGNDYVDLLMRTTDAAEGLTAFTEKRAPVWRHQ